VQAKPQWLCAKNKKMKILNLFYFIALFILLTGGRQKPGELIGIKILTGKDTYNPLLELNLTEDISALGIFLHGNIEKISDREIVYKSETKLVSYIIINIH
jgi:hypothetical protein